MAEQTDSSSDKQTGSDAREVADVGRSSAASRLSQPPGRRTGRRRRPPAWAVSLAARIAALQQFFRTRLPALLKNRRREISTVLLSFAVHLLIGLLFAAWMMPDVATDGVLRLLGVADDPSEDLQADDIPQIVQPDSMQDLQVDSTMKQMLSELDRGTQRMNLNSPRPEDLTLPVDDLQDLSEIPVMRGEFGGRSEAGRRAAVKKFGGSADSERAVNAGLTWLQKVQKQDGSWSFDEVGGAGQGGTLQATPMGATSLALLTFLGGGHTHEIKGEYQETVTRGLNWLLSKAETTSSGLDLRGTAQGNSGLYVQGIATICLCEAAALAPKDRTLKRAATSAIRFVERSQDRLGGGWRYTPNQPGDTSVTGWQIMALQSAKANRISVAADTMQDARAFLRSVSVENGARYAYMPRGGPTDTMTAVGLLCQMYMGWRRDRPELQAGVQHLATVGPSRENMYYNYYATQVLHHWGGELWEQWNLKMREQLVTTQLRNGPGAGSWDVTDPHGNGGGRIYQTALSVLTLEVYYRHLPMYRRLDEAAEKEATASKQ
ncbi:MAG: prenyltransferase/squalene oxidase repeat-containing protein [Planctomyces sp.]